jgi:hypothetical protein
MCAAWRGACAHSTGAERRARAGAAGKLMPRNSDEMSFLIKMNPPRFNTLPPRVQKMQKAIARRRQEKEARGR